MRANLSVQLRSRWMSLLLTCLHPKHMGALCDFNSKSEGLPLYCPPVPRDTIKTQFAQCFQGCAYYPGLLHFYWNFSLLNMFQVIQCFRKMSVSVVLAPPNPSQFTKSILSPEIQCPFPSLCWHVELLSLIAKANPSQSTLKRKRKSSLLHDRRCDCIREPSKAKPGYTTIQEE